MNANTYIAPSLSLKCLVAFSIFISITLTANLPAQIQQDESIIRLRLAQSFEQSGEWEKATRIYESLLEIDPNNYVYFDGLRRGYTQVKEYDRAILLVRKRLINEPNDPSLLATLGGLYFQNGERSAADSIWNVVIHSNSKNINLYRLVASQMMEFRLYDLAIDLYLGARRETEQHGLFREEVAMLYGALMQYGNAAREYISMLSGNPDQLSYVQSRLSQFTQRTDGLKSITQVIREEVQRNPDYAPIRLLYAWALMEDKEYVLALNEHRTIDRLTSSNGDYIFNFAERASQEKRFHPAAEAFKEVLDRYPNHHKIRHARFGFIRSIEEINSTNPASSQETVVAEKKNQKAFIFSPAEILTMYESILKNYPGTDVAFHSIYRIGILKRQRLLDRDGAIKAFEQVRISSLAGEFQTQASIQLAEILTEKNRLSDAIDLYEDIRKRTQGNLWELATYRKAEIFFFRSEFDTALATLKLLTQQLNQNFANDALQLQYFIEENKSTAVNALTAFADAAFAEYQGKLSEALARFEEIIKQFPKALLVDDSMIRVGNLQVNLQRSDDALRTFHTVVETMTLSIFRDKAQMRIAEIFATMKNDQKRAIEEYEKVLSLFPTSVYLEEARQRIRILRGDSL